MTRIPNWDERYDAAAYLFGTEPNDYLKSVAGELLPASRVICLADGEGRNGVYLASLGHDVTAVDQSRRGLAKARQLASDRGVAINTIQADLAEYDLGSHEWDAIVSIFFHMTPELRDIIYPRIVTALAPGGLLILESYRPEQLKFGTGGPPIAEMMLTRDILDEKFAELDFIHCEALERDVIEGSGHTGRAAVIQLLARA